MQLKAELGAYMQVSGERLQNCNLITSRRSFRSTDLRCKTNITGEHQQSSNMISSSARCFIASNIQLMLSFFLFFKLQSMCSRDGVAVCWLAANLCLRVLHMMSPGGFGFLQQSKNMNYMLNTDSALVWNGCLSSCCPVMDGQLVQAVHLWKWDQLPTTLMDGWMGGKLDGWIDEWIDMDVWMDGWTLISLLWQTLFSFTVINNNFFSGF